MSVGAVVTGFIILAIFAFLYITIGHLYDKYYDMNNDMISSDEYYSADRGNAMSNQFQVWYVLPVAVFFGTIFYMILEAIQKRDNII